MERKGAPRSLQGREKRRSRGFWLGVCGCFVELLQAGLVLQNGGKCHWRRLLQGFRRISLLCSYFRRSLSTSVLGLAISFLGALPFIAGRLPNVLFANAAFSVVYGRRRQKTLHQHGTLCPLGTIGWPPTPPDGNGLRRRGDRIRWDSFGTIVARRETSRRRAAGFFAGAYFVPVALQIAVKTRPPNSKYLRRPQPVSLA